MADRDDRYPAQPAKQRYEVGLIESAVQRVDGRRSDQPAEWKGEIVDVAMDHVEIGCAVEHLRQLKYMRGDPIRGRWIEAQRAFDRTDELGARVRVPAREEGDLMAAAGKLVGETRHNAFGAPVKQGWNALV